MPEDYVKRSDVHKAFQPKYAPAINRTFAAMIDSVPAADVVEVRHGRWIDRPSKRGYGLSTYCSCCGQHSGIGGIESNRHRAYCPNCGAKMDGWQDNG